MCVSSHQLEQGTRLPCGEMLSAPRPLPVLSPSSPPSSDTAIRGPVITAHVAAKARYPTINEPLHYLHRRRLGDTQIFPQLFLCCPLKFTWEFVVIYIVSSRASCQRLTASDLRAPHVVTAVTLKYIICGMSERPSGVCLSCNTAAPRTTLHGRRTITHSSSFRCWIYY